MPEHRLLIGPSEFLHMEILCSECKNVTAMSLSPPKQDLEKHLGIQAAHQCMWCGRRFPLGLATLIEKFQEHFTLLSGHAEFGLSFAVKQ